MPDIRGTLMEMSNRGVSPVLIGRTAEMAALADTLRTVRQGDPATLLIGGEAGVGKTRLIKDSFPNEPWYLLSGPCLEIGADGLPYAPFTAMLRDLVREAGAEEITTLLPGGSRAARELARLLPELGTAPVPDPGVGNDGNGPRPAEESRALLFESFLTLLERLAARSPLALVVEDAHWADRSSRDLLAFLIRYQRSLPGVAIVVTFRSDELHRTHPLRPLLAELSRIDWVDSVDLPRLTRRQSAELTAAILRREPDAALVDALYARAEGNPLFTEELIAAANSTDAVPWSLADLLLRAVRRMPEPTQEVLRVASASSGTVGSRLLAAVTGQSEDGLAGILRPAVTGNVLVASADGYDFRHALIREAVSDDLLPGEPGRIHSRYAEAIDADPSLVPPGRADIVKAHHWHAARNTTWALISAWQAARQAGCSFAHAERLMLLARVLDLWDQVPDAADRIGADHVRVIEEAVSAAMDTGEFQRGLAFAAAAIAELDERAEPARIAELLGRQAVFKENLGLPGSAEDLNRALDLLPDSVPVALRFSLLTDSISNTDDWQQPQIARWVDEALRSARAAEDPKAESQALLMLAILKSLPASAAGSDTEPIRLIAQARDMARRADAYEPRLKAAQYESHLLCGNGEYERAAAVARQGIADAEQYGVARTAGAALAINVAEPLLALGRWDEVLDIAERTLELAPPPRVRTPLWVMSGSIALARGDMGTAAKMATDGRSVLARLRYEDQFHPALGLLEIDLALATDGPDAAVAVAGHLLDRFDLPVSGARYLWPFVAVTAWAAGGGTSDTGSALLNRLRTIAEKLDCFGPVQDAWRLTFTAINADTPAQPDPAAGLAAWNTAVTAWECLRQPQQTATALTLAARAALSGGDRQAAAEHLRRAAPIAEGLGARPLSERITDLARRAGVDLPGSATRPGAGGGVILTSRESEVLRLLAAGQSNKDIAAALFISPKTASVHVSNILGKVGAATRTEAAAKARSLGLLDNS
jgi:DNA-binding CsgD family transcriptional regulator/tetratricopeptide (TPR) repeat protein